MKDSELVERAKSQHSTVIAELQGDVDEAANAALYEQPGSAHVLAVRPWHTGCPFVSSHAVFPFPPQSLLLL